MLLLRWGKGLQGQLLEGMRPSPQLVVAARKAQYGVRPIALWGFPERVVYRALVDFILRNEEPLDRSPAAYLQFVGGPVSYARELEPRNAGLVLGFRVGGSELKYVVQSDIASFYEHVDHGVLTRELLAKTGDHEPIEALRDLLAEVEGRGYGLPQLLDPSDRLSEVYIDIVERDLVRRGWPTWRFNDDFRIAARSFSEVLACLEDLAAASRQVGLNLSEAKTTTPRFSTYAFKHFSLQVDDEIPSELSLDDPSDLVGDYTEGVGDADPTWAIELLRNAWSPESIPTDSEAAGLDLLTVHGDDFRQLRRALGRMIAVGAVEPLQHMTKFFAYTPSLTPWLCRYVIAAGASDSAAAAEILDAVIAKLSLGDWQRVWIVRALDELNLLDPGAPGVVGRRAGWVAELQHGRYAEYLGAEALLALARPGLADALDIDHGLRERPAVLMPWHLAAVARMHTNGKLTNQEYAAYREEGSLQRALLPRLPAQSEARTASNGQ